MADPAPPKPSILIQLDVDPQPSVFDGVVAVDAGVDHLFRHGGVEPGAVPGLVHGALFTRGPADLKRTAIFVGGSDVEAAEAILGAVRSTFFAGFRVSALLDANGCNTTAASAVLAALAGSDGSIEGKTAAVLGGTGPVGRRVARLLAKLGGEVRIGSRDQGRAEQAARAIGAKGGRPASAFSTSDEAGLVAALEGVSIVVAAGAAGVTLLPVQVSERLIDLRVAVDLNAVPPSGIAGVEPTDKDVDRRGIRCWGALGVGGRKMKIHKAAIRALFEANDRILDVEEVFEIGRSLD